MIENEKKNVFVILLIWKDKVLFLLILIWEDTGSFALRTR
jgi:hypothetical protein